MAPLSLEQTLLRAKGYERKGELAEAKRLYQSILASFPGNERAKKALAALGAPKDAAQATTLPQALLAQLVALYKQGQLQRVVQETARLAGVYPQAFILWQLNGVANKGLGRTAEAEAGFRKALKLSPDYADAHNNLGNVLREQGKAADAMASYRRALAIKPDHADALSNLGQVLTEQGDPAEAVVCLRRALDIRPDFAEAAINLGLALSEQGTADEAVLAYRRATEIQPGLAEAHSSLGLALSEQGTFAEAAASFERAIAIRPGAADAHRSLSAIKRYAEGDAQLAMMLQQHERADISDADRCHLSFGLAKAYGDLGDLGRSFHYLRAGNALRRKLLGHDPDKDRKLFASIREQQIRSRDIALAPAESGGGGPAPIFILGMPRSGTTLVEQIVSSHSAVAGAGELKYASQFGMALATGPRPIKAAELAGFRSAYLGKLATFSRGKPFVTDKYPHNFLLVGLLRKAFPDARIVHVRRDPRAVLWSNYKTYFAGRGMGYSCDLGDLVEYHRLYAELMDFWEQEFPGAVYHLDYEALTENPDAETRRLIAHLGLGWEDACLSPERNSRSVRTTSQQQVRARIYTGSSQEWRKYEPYLDGAFDRLA